MMIRYVIVNCGSFNPVHNFHLKILQATKDEVIKRHNAKPNPKELIVFTGILSPSSDGWKKKGLQPYNLRNKMCYLACKNSDWVKLSNLEGLASLEEWTQTIVVLRDLLDLYRNGEKGNQGLGKWPYDDDFLDKYGDKQDHENGPEEVISDKMFTEIDHFKKTNTKVTTKLIFAIGSDLYKLMEDDKIWTDHELTEIFTNYQVSVIFRKGSDRQDCSNVLKKRKLFVENPEFVEKIIFIENLDEMGVEDNDLSSTMVRNHLLEGKSVKNLVPDLVAVEWVDYRKKYTKFGEFILTSCCFANLPQLASNPITETLSLFWFPTTIQFRSGLKLKFLGVFPPDFTSSGPFKNPFSKILKTAMVSLPLFDVHK